MTDTSLSCPLCAPPDPALLITELPLSTVRLNEDQFFPGYCFVVLGDHVKEPHHLPPEARAALMEDVWLVARALEAVFSPDKINVESLGNMVPHVHWHVVPRFRADALWPRPIWAEPHEPVILEPEARLKRIDAIMAEIARLARSG